LLTIYTICIMALDHLFEYNFALKGMASKVFTLVFFDNHLFDNLNVHVLKKNSLQKSLLCALQIISVVI
jgi:hypothetical protein